MTDRMVRCTWLLAAGLAIAALAASCGPSPEAVVTSAAEVDEVVTATPAEDLATPIFTPGPDNLDEGPSDDELVAESLGISTDAVIAQRELLQSLRDRLTDHFEPQGIDFNTVVADYGVGDSEETGGHVLFVGEVPPGIPELLRDLPVDIDAGGVISVANRSSVEAAVMFDLMELSDQIDLPRVRTTPHAVTLDIRFVGEPMPEAELASRVRAVLEPLGLGDVEVQIRYL